MAQILVVDDEVGIRELLSEILTDEGHHVLLAESAGAARKLREKQRPDLVLLDIWMPDTDGISLLKEWSASGQLGMPVVMMSGHGTIDTAVEATRIGAQDFLEKPIALQRLLATVRRALRNAESVVPTQFSLAGVGRSSALNEVRKRLSQLATQAAPLMLRGEPGMRPELFVRLLLTPGSQFLQGHEALGEQANEALMRAAGGIVFVADLARLGRAEQRALAFLLERAPRHKVRIVSFSSLDGAQLIERHEFDAGLVQQLAQLNLRLPSLRQLIDDVPEIAAAMVAHQVESRTTPPRRLSVAAQNALRNHAWSGNFDELAAVVRDLAATSLDEEISPDDVTRVFEARGPAAPSTGLALDRPYREARDEFERQYFGHLLTTEGGSMSRVADKSGLERTHLYRKLKALGLPVGRREES